MIDRKTSLEQKVYQSTKQIPRGQVMSYGQLALQCGIKNPRLVGRILHNNPDPKNVPCHRVVRADGTIADGYAFGRRKAQIAKLRGEGIKVANSRVLRAYLIK